MKYFIVLYGAEEVIEALRRDAKIGSEYVGVEVLVSLQNKEHVLVGFGERLSFVVIASRVQVTDSIQKELTRHVLV